MRAVRGPLNRRQPPRGPLPDNPLGARNWLRFGREASPAVGAVMVFWRGSKGGWTGQLGVCMGEDRGAFHILGGNQSNQVNVVRLAKDRLLGARWPETAGIRPGRTLVSAGGGGLSEDDP